MPDRRQLGGFEINERLSERKPSEIARDLGVRPDDLTAAAEDLEEGVRNQMDRGRRMLHYVPDKLRQAGDASRRAGRRVGSFARNHPVATGAIGLGSAAVLGGAIMLARRRRAMKNAEEAVEEGTKASVKSRRRPAKR